MPIALSPALAGLPAPTILLVAGCALSPVLATAHIALLPEVVLLLTNPLVV